MVNPESVKSVLGTHILADGYDIVMDMERSSGSWIVDKKTGVRYLDMFSMYASMAVGYNHPYILSQADYLGKMAVNKPSMSDIYNVHYANLIERFSEIAIPDELPYTFFISGGALAVENALKTAFDWKTKMNFKLGFDVEADQVIHFREAFHGRSGYTLSLTNTADIRKIQHFPKFEWPRIVNPKLYFPLTEESLQRTILQEQEALDQISEALQQFDKRIACIIIEPIQCEGGDNHFRKEFLLQLREICDQHHLLLIFDEVQTGMGMTGKMWAYQNYGVLPDILAFGKKTQVCGMLASKEKLDMVEGHVFEESSRINSTFGGNFVDMVRLKLILEIIRDEHLVANAAEKGAYLLGGLEQLAHKYPNLLSNARGLGLLCAFDLPGKEVRDLVKSKAFEQQLMILGCGPKSIRFRPHLNVKTNEIDLALEILEKVIQGVA